MLQAFPFVLQEAMLSEGSEGANYLVYESVSGFMSHQPFRKGLVLDHLLTLMWYMVKW